MNNEDNEVLPFRFKVSGNIIKKFGEESITNKNIAILEIIKNSYDAGASRVEVFFKHEEIPEYASIEISDDGEGMTFSDLENKWMNIATPSKLKQLLNKKFNRPVVGEKGIGRLSSESLGKESIIITYPRGEGKGYEVNFDWNKYQKQDVLVGEVINEGKSFTKTKGKHGTEISICKLKHNWNNQNSQKELLKDIYLLNPPNKPLKDFKINPKFHQYLKDFKKIRKSFFSNSSYSLKTRLTKGNILRYEFCTINGKKRKGVIPLEKSLNCGDIYFELFFYYRRNKELKTNLQKELFQPEIKEINEILDDYKGIKLYRDNFRVKPYGDLKNDWIELEIAGQNSSMCPRNNQIIGMVHINKSKNPKIVDTTTREGVIFTPEFQDLISFVRTSIIKLFIDLRSEEESDKKKARKKPSITSMERKVSKKDVLEVTPSQNYEEKSKENKFVDAKGDYPQNFYIKIEDEINGCYDYGFPNATFFLCRKFIENFIYNILEKKFKDEEEIWWDKTEFINQAKGLSSLIRSLKTNKKRFKPNITRYIEKILPNLNKIRNDVNPMAHNLHDYLERREELNQYKINETIQILVHIWNNL